MVERLIPHSHILCGSGSILQIRLGNCRDELIIAWFCTAHVHIPEKVWLISWRAPLLHAHSTRRLETRWTWCGRAAESWQLEMLLLLQCTYCWSRLLCVRHNFSWKVGIVARKSAVCKYSITAFRHHFAQLWTVQAWSDSYLAIEPRALGSSEQREWLPHRSSIRTRSLLRQPA